MDKLTLSTCDENPLPEKTRNNMAGREKFVCGYLSFFVSPPRDCSGKASSESMDGKGLRTLLVCRRLYCLLSDHRSLSGQGALSILRMFAGKLWIPTCAMKQPPLDMQLPYVLLKQFLQTTLKGFPKPEVALVCIPPRWRT